MEQALKSSDKDFILQVADEFYEEGKWANAIDLYSKIMVAFAGTEQGPDIAYKQADANFKTETIACCSSIQIILLSYPADPEPKTQLFVRLIRITPTHLFTTVTK